MAPYIPKTQYKDLFRRLYTHEDLASFETLTHHLSEPPDYYKHSLAFSPANFTPTSIDVDGAYLFPFVAPQQVPQSRIIEHVVYDHELNPVTIANHIKAFYNGYEDHPDLPAYPFSKNTILEHIPGTSYYMGLLLPHFGHFILEVITRLWCRLKDEEKKLSKFIFHIVGQRDEEGIKQNLFGGYWKAYFDAFGITPDNFVVANRPLHCDNLIVPQCALSIGVYRAPDCFLSKDAVRVWRETHRRIIDSTPHTDQNSAYERIYISRRKVENPFQGRLLENEEDIEQLLMKKGFHILYPEDIKSEAEKHVILSQCRTLTALSGSGLMNSVFLPKGSKVLQIISDQINRGLPGLEQQISIDTLCEHHSYVYYQDDYVSDTKKSARIDLRPFESAIDSFLYDK